MSISLVKRQFEEFRAYLNKDTEGQRRLKLLKDAVNEIRTQLADAQAECEKANALYRSMKERADNAEIKSESLSRENSTLQHRLQSVSRRLELHDAAQPQTEADDDNDLSGVMSESRMRTIMRDIRKGNRVLSRAMDRTRRFADVVSVFSIDQLCNDYSHHELYRLGASVAVLSMMEPVCIKSAFRMRDLKLKGETDDSAAVKLFMQWWAPCNTSSEHTSCRAGFARLVNLTTEQEIANGIEAKMMPEGGNRPIDQIIPSNR